MGAIQLDVGKKNVEVWLETVAPEGRSRMGYAAAGEGEEPEKKVAPAQIAAAVTTLADGLAPSLDGKKGPDEVSIDFGISLDPTARVVVGQGGTFKVSLRWKKSS